MDDRKFKQKISLYAFQVLMMYEKVKEQIAMGAIKTDHPINLVVTEDDEVLLVFCQEDIDEGTTLNIKGERP